MQELKTRERQTQYRSERILRAALDLFCEKGLEETSIEDVAKHAKVGPATIYRYFQNKAELAIQSAIAYWKKISEKYTDIMKTDEWQNYTGYEQLIRIFDIFIKIFENEYLFLKFLLEFDIFIHKYQISKERLKEYEDYILNLKPYVTNALEKGLSDHSLNFTWSSDEVYFAITHTMLSLMQKFACHGNLLHSDEWFSLSSQLKIIKELLLKGLKQEVH